MTTSVTLSGLPGAGANSKPHHFKQKVQKLKDLPKTWVLTGKSLNISDEKKTLLAWTEQPRGTHGPLKTTIEHGPCKQ